ncbi:MAG: MoaD/ThiS family protein [Syntrophorhabdaceae bacterium]|jgi:molybdopterin converting factor small subunit|nr:MoaD/ThiS family protein [Syntrophorhabdaceae bacterium]MDD4196483.1 MoaD/ThiS family protein [Syntrophorhabdaceae bacterium]HOC46126.1 MoaD/ThiS family protein [Syntrophorhabdaceae bacterium]
MIKVTVKLFATLQLGRFEVRDEQFAEGTTVHDVMKKYGLTKKQVLLILINGRHAEDGTPLADGDTVALFPPIGGG